MNIDQYKELVANYAQCRKQEVLPNKHNLDDFVKRMEDNLLTLAFRGENGGN